MSDRTTEIREALALVGGPAGKSWAGEFFLVHQAVIDAARAYADLLDSDPLIIRRDENGEWPSSATDVAVSILHGRLTQPCGPIVRAVLDSLAAVVDTPKENQ